MKDSQTHTTETIVLGGGCFWCVEAALSQVQGVVAAVSGYAGGSVEHPTYEQVCDGTTGHAEVVKVDFDSRHISLETILYIFFTVHDPTTLNRQGADIGTQYRSVIFYTDENQKKTISNVVAQLEHDAVFTDPIVTEVQLLDHFYPAENYHQQYYFKNPTNRYCQAIINPKLQKIRDTYSKLLK